MRSPSSRPAPLELTRPSVRPDPVPDPSRLERRGRWWLAVSFLFCPCHLPLTLGLLAGVFGGTALGTLLRDHGWVAAALIGATWLAGTARGLVWVRRAERGQLTCAVPNRR